MPQINLQDFFGYFKGEVQQKEAVQLLQQAMPDSLLRDDSAWVVKYREKPPEPESPLPPQGVALICEFEGFRPTVYNDGVGVPTIGYGSTFYLDGRKVAWGDPPVTEPEARKMMEAIAEKDFWNVISHTIPYWEDMNDNQRSALLSFAYNLGAHFYGSGGFNTISACLREHAWNEVPEALNLYCNPGSPVEAGLRRRRAAEGELWAKA
jgi:GH24 family phage-related lysozyme (muramidase)